MWNRMVQFLFIDMGIGCFVLLYIVQLTAAEIHIGASNAAVSVGDEAILYCRDNYSNCNEQCSNKAVWKLRNLGLSDVILTITSGRVSLNNTRIGQFDLVIKNTTFQDAGTYICLTKQSEYTSQLIVLDSGPTCHVSINKSEIIELQCSVNYRGNWRPKMKWHIVNGSELPSTDTYLPNSSLTSVSSIVKRSTIATLVSAKTAQYACEVIFESDYSPVFNKISAKNIPTYRRIWTSSLMETRSQTKDDAGDNNRKTETGSSQSADQKMLTISLVSLVGIVIVVLVILAIVFIAKNCEGQKSKHCNDATANIDCYAVISERGNTSSHNYPNPSNGISSSHFDARSLYNRSGSHFSQERPQRFEEDELAAYSETRTIASVPVHFLSSRSMLSVNQQTAKSDSLGRTARYLLPSVDSAMPVYAEVQKPKTQKFRNNSPSDAMSDASDEKQSANKTIVTSHKTNIGADGTVYMELGKNNAPNRSIPIKKKCTEMAVYAMVDHTRRMPPPPPPE